MTTLASMIVKNDILCFYALNRKISCSLLNSSMKAITQIGSLAFAISTGIFFLIYNRMWGITLIINLLASQAVIQTIKRMVKRPRPYKTFEWVKAINPPSCKYSLPSGHSSAAMCLAMVLSSFFPWLKFLFIAAAILVGVSRIYLGCHYPTDVLVGFSVSIITFKLIQLLVIM